VVRLVPDVADSGPAVKFESIIETGWLWIGHNLPRWAAARNGSNPARARVTSMARPRRAEIFALPAFRYPLIKRLILQQPRPTSLGRVRYHARAFR
jgi:hypothetical protein